MLEPHEARRKVVHMLGALGPPVSVSLFGWAASVAILVFILTYVVVGALLLARGIRLPVIAHMIERTRREHEAFPTAPVQFFVAILVVGLVFPEDMFFPAIALLAIGDGTAALVGLAWGRHTLPWNRVKSWEGLGAGLVAGTAAVAAFTLVGMEVHGQSYGYEPIIGANVYVVVPAFLLGGFLLVVALDRFLGPERGAPRPRHGIGAPAAVVASGLAGALAILTLLHGRFGPFYPDAYVAMNNTDVSLAYVLLVAPFVMLLESFLRRDDNIILPVAFVLANFALLVIDPLGLGPIVA